VALDDSLGIQGEAKFFLQYSCSLSSPHDNSRTRSCNKIVCHHVRDALKIVLFAELSHLKELGTQTLFGTVGPCLSNRFNKCIADFFPG